MDPCFKETYGQKYLTAVLPSKLFLILRSEIYMNVYEITILMFQCCINCMDLKIRLKCLENASKGKIPH